MSGVLQWQDFKSDNLKSWNLILVTSAFRYLTSKISVAIQWQSSLNFKYFLAKPNNEHSLCHSSQHDVTVLTSMMCLTVFLQQLCALLFILRFWGRNLIQKRQENGSYFSTAKFGLIVHLEHICGFVLLCFALLLPLLTQLKRGFGLIHLVSG